MVNKHSHTEARHSPTDARTESHRKHKLNICPQKVNEETHEKFASFTTKRKESWNWQAKSVF